MYQTLYNTVTKISNSRVSNLSNEINLVNLGGTKSHVFTTPFYPWFRDASFEQLLYENDEDVLIVANLFRYGRMFGRKIKLSKWDHV